MNMFFKDCLNFQQMKNQHTSPEEKFDFIVQIIDRSLKQDKQFTQIQDLSIKKYLANQEIDFMMGCMFGAFMGDALGSYCEFKKEVHPSVLKQAMRMQGGGTWGKIQPAQFTDDSELASHLLSGLVNFDKNIGDFQKQKNSLLWKIAEQYVKWYKSQPFDIGFTTRSGLQIVHQGLSKRGQKDSNEREKQSQNDLQLMLTKIQLKNGESKSNGSLMRITPMAFFISLMILKDKQSKLRCQDFKSFIKCQINMTHGLQQMHEVGYAWVQLLVDVILRKRNNASLKHIYEDFISRYKNNSFLKEWISAAEMNQEVNATVQQGRAIIAFSLGLKRMKALVEKKEEQMGQQDYTKIIENIISKAGDTDTNGAIVGGLMGAILGFRKLPQVYLKKQFELKLTNEKQGLYRGPFYQPNKQFFKAIKFLKDIDYFENENKKQSSKM